MQLNTLTQFQFFSHVLPPLLFSPLPFSFSRPTSPPQFYGGQYTKENGFDEPPRANFDTLGNSLMTVFQVITGENWNDIMYDCMQVNGVGGAIYTSLMFCMGNYIVLNLFLAILLDNFQKTEGEEQTTFYEEIEKQNDIVEAFKVAHRFLFKKEGGLPIFLRWCWRMFRCSPPTVQENEPDGVETGTEMVHVHRMFGSSTLHSAFSNVHTLFGITDKSDEDDGASGERGRLDSHEEREKIKTKVRYATNQIVKVNAPPPPPKTIHGMI